MDILHVDFKERIPMTGGTYRRTPPRDFAADPQHWPDTTVPDHGQARVVLTIAQALERHIARQGYSLRQVAAATGVNRQVVANLLGGASWIDVVTVSLLEDGLDVVLWPGATVRASTVGR